MSAWDRIAGLFSMARIFFRPVQTGTLESIQQAVRQRFPSVPHLSTVELAAWLAAPDRPQPLLVDVRGAKAFAVSHLGGARSCTTVSSVQSAMASPAHPVVLYCSVGYRASALAEKLQRAGFTNVFNLEGSLFQWVNEGRTLYRGTNVVRDIHGYSRKWGQMLNADVPVKF